MALIKCSECGKDVSDKAVHCPNCGNPVMSESGNLIDYKPIGDVNISSIILFAGGVISIISCFLPYVYQELYLTNTTFNFNIFNVLSEESGGKSDTNLIFPIFPFLILIFAGICAGIGFYEIKNKKKFENKKVIKITVVINAILFLVFEFIGTSPYKDSCKSLIESINNMLSSGSIGEYGYGTGFYGLIVGIIISLIAVFAKDKLDAMKVI